MAKYFSDFTLNVFKLSGGSAIAQIIGLLLMPVITRLFAPQDFGLLALFISMTSILGTISCFHYDLAIMLPETDEGALNLMAVSLTCAAIFALLSGLILIIIKDPLLSVFNAQSLGNYIWIIPAAVFITGLNQTFICWNSRTQQFMRQSIARIVQSAICHPSRVIFGLAEISTAWVLIGTWTAGQMVAALFLVAGFLKLHLHGMISSISLKNMTAAMRRYQNFPKYNILSSLIVGGSMELPILMFAYSFSPFLVGCFALTRNVLRLPLALIGKAIYQPFFQKTAAMKIAKEDLKPAVVNLFDSLLSLAVPPFAALSVVGVEIFSFVFGEKWDLSGTIARLVCFSIVIEFATAPAGSLFDTLGKQKAGLFLNLNLFFMRFFGLATGLVLNNFLLAITLFVISDIAGRIIKYMWIFQQVGITSTTFIRILIEKFILSSPILVALYLAKFFIVADYALFGLFVGVIILHFIYFLNKIIPIKQMYLS